MKTPELSDTAEKLVKSLFLISIGALVIKGAQYLEISEEITDHIRNVADNAFADPSVY